MKKSIVVVLALLFSLVLASLLSSCNSPIRSKALVVVNDSANAIDMVSIRQYVSGAKASSPNALATGETIAAGSNKTFFIAPYATDSIHLNIQDEGVGNASEDFFYDYKVNRRNREITATYDGTTITLSGSNVTLD